MTAQSEIRPVTFKNRKGFDLFGILQLPPESQRETGIIILSPGIKNRVAPHRLYVKMARRFINLGFPVLRFDPEGLGDSAGHINEKYTADLYGSIQVGRFVNDTIDAMDWMEKNYGTSHFILAGLCGGAITGLLAGALDQRVYGLLGLGIPVILDSAGIDQTKYMTKGQLEHVGHTYVRKLLNIKAWMRFLSLKSDYRLVSKSILTAIRSKVSNTAALRPVPPRERDRARGKSNGLDSNFNPYFPAALHNMLSNRKVFLIFSEADRLFWEFEEKYLNVYSKDIEPLLKQFRMSIVKDANHIFSFTEWQEEMLQQSCEWLSKCS